MNILTNLRSAFNRNRRRNVVAASAAAMVIAAVAGTATAVTLTIDLPRTYESLVALALQKNPGVTPIYTVASGKKLMVTDVIISNPETFATSVTMVHGTSGCSSQVIKLATVYIPALDTVDLNFVTGLYFGP